MQDYYAAPILAYARVYGSLRAAKESLNERSFNALRGAVARARCPCQAHAHHEPRDDPLLELPWVREELLSIAGVAALSNNSGAAADDACTTFTVHATLIHVVTRATTVRIGPSTGKGARWPTAPTDLVLSLTPGFEPQLEVVTMPDGALQLRVDGSIIAVMDNVVNAAEFMAEVDERRRLLATFPPSPELHIVPSEVKRRHHEYVARQSPLFVLHECFIKGGFTSEDVLALLVREDVMRRRRRHRRSRVLDRVAFVASVLTIGLERTRRNHALATSAHHREVVALSECLMEQILREHRILSGKPPYLTSS